MTERSLESQVWSEVLRTGQDAISLLLEARQIALDANCDAWQFAIELSCLAERGLSRTHLRWMVYHGLVRHADEVTLRGAKRRSFEPSECLQFSEDSCFVIAERGVNTLSAAGESLKDPRVPNKTPIWQAESRELRYEGELVKQFRRPAPNQELVLASFQEDCWTLRIDDPLAPQEGMDPKRRLHDTINALNRNQRHPCVRFFGDGTGEGICWEARLGQGGDFPAST